MTAAKTLAFSKRSMRVKPDCQRTIDNLFRRSGIIKSIRPRSVRFTAAPPR
jgi:hypothetical protein